MSLLAVGQLAKAARCTRTHLLYREETSVFFFEFSPKENYDLFSITFLIAWSQ